MRGRKEILEKWTRERGRGKERGGRIERRIERRRREGEDI
jgi:hypothetical protein